MLAPVDIETSFQRRTEISVQGSKKLVPEIIDTVGVSTDSSDPRPKLWAGWAPNYPSLMALGKIDETWQAFVNLVPESKAEYYHLEAGCGNGEIIDRLRPRIPNAHIVGADLSPEFLHETQKRIGETMQDALGKVALWRVDLTEPLPWPDNTFGAATMNLVFQYLSREEQYKAVEQVSKKLEPGGKFYLSTFTEGHTFGQLLPGLFGSELKNGNFKGVRGILPHMGIPMQFSKHLRAGRMNHPSVYDLKRMHDEAGFRKFEVSGPMFGDIGVFTVATK